MFKLAAIGLDTSHTVAFTDLIQGQGRVVDGLRVISCMRFPSAFQSESGQNERQKKLERMGVTVTRSFEDTVSGADGILLEINDPALHLEYFSQAAKIGVPIFLDKPMADTLENGKKICETAQKKGLSVWSSSALRFIPEIIDCKMRVKFPQLCNFYGPLGEAPKGSSIVWYGVHAFEMLMTLMGPGARTVFSRRDPCGVVSVVEYSDERRGVVECNRVAGKYGGRAEDAEAAVPYVAEGNPYPGLIEAMQGFFLEGTIPVPLGETLEIQAMLEASEKSLASGEVEKIGA